MSFKVGPILIFNFVLLLFLVVDALVIYFMYKTQVKNYVGWTFIILLTFFLLFILYSMNFGFKVSEKQLMEVQKRKDTIVFDKDGFTVLLPVLAEQHHVKWHTIEAVFLENAPPREGDYHSFRYIIFLNEPFIERSGSGKKQSNTSTTMYINDFKNTSFSHFSTNLKRYLLGVNPKTEAYLQLKYGNTPNNGFTKNKRDTYTLYKIFDRGNATNITELVQYRKSTKE